MSFKITWKMHLICLSMTMLICYIMKDSLAGISVGLIINAVIPNITGNLLLDELIFFTLVFIPINIVHELLHGSVYKLFGGKVKYGFKGIYAYTQETSGVTIHITKFLLVLLAPITIISIIALLIPGEIGGLIFFINLAGSTGDLFMSLYLCKYNKSCYIVDKKSGFDVVSKPRCIKLVIKDLNQ